MITGNIRNKVDKIWTDIPAIKNMKHNRLPNFSPQDAGNFK